MKSTFPAIGIACLLAFVVFLLGTSNMRSQVTKIKVRNQDTSFCPCRQSLFADSLRNGILVELRDRNTKYFLTAPVTVTVTRESDSLEVCKTGMDSVFTFRSLPVGYYTISVCSRAYKPYSAFNVALGQGKYVSFSIALQRADRKKKR